MLHNVLLSRGGSRNSLRGGSGPEFFGGGGGFRVQVRGNFHILTSKQKKKTSEGGFLNPLTPPPPLDPLLLSIVSGKNYDTLTSITAKLLTSWPFGDISQFFKTCS